MGMEGLSDLLSSLSPDDMANLKNMASSLLGGQGAEGGQQAKEEAPKEESGGLNFSGDDMAMLMRVRGIMQKMNQKDSRSDLILALKPHLSEKRQKRADEAIRMMHLMELLPALKDMF